MLALARRRLLIPAALVALVLLVGCGGKDQPQTMGNVLPTDTLAWLHLDDLPALESALESYGLMDLLVEELDKPGTREEMEAELGIVLAEDPRVTIHALLQELVRADVSAHVPLHEGTEHPVAVVHLECIDEAAAGRVMDLIGKHADAEITVGTHMAFRIDAEDDLSFVLGQHGAHVVVATEAERWGEIMGAVIDPPLTALVDSEGYQRVVGSEAGQVTAYVAPDFQTELRGLGVPHGGINAAAMGPLMDKYGSEYTYLAMDYLLSRILMRQAFTEGSPLEPLMVCADGEAELMTWLPASTFLYEGWLVENGRAKMELIQELITDALGTMSEAAPGQLPPTGDDPIATAEGMIGFSMLDLAERVREVALAGADAPGWLIMLRAHDEIQAQEITDMFTGIPALAMLAEGAPAMVGDTTLRSFAWPGDPEGRVQFIGRHADTMLMAINVADAAAMEAFLGQVGSGGFLGAVPTHASRQLQQPGCGWGYLELSGLLTTLDQNPAEMFEDLPPALAQRLRGLRAAGHGRLLEGGVSETVLETGAP